MHRIFLLGMDSGSFPQLISSCIYAQGFVSSLIMLSVGYLFSVSNRSSAIQDLELKNRGAKMHKNYFVSRAVTEGWIIHDSFTITYPLMRQTPTCVRNVPHSLTRPSDGSRSSSVRGTFGCALGVRLRFTPHPLRARRWKYRLPNRAMNRASKLVGRRLATTPVIAKSKFVEAVQKLFRSCSGLNGVCTVNQEFYLFIHSFIQTISLLRNVREKALQETLKSIQTIPPT
jgi:hypothetical protein